MDLDRVLRQTQLGGGRLQRDDRALQPGPDLGAVRPNVGDRAFDLERTRGRPRPLELALDGQRPWRRIEKRRDRGLELRQDRRVRLSGHVAVAPRDVERAGRGVGLAERLGHHRDGGRDLHDEAAGGDDDDLEHARHRPDHVEVVDAHDGPADL